MLARDDGVCNRLGCVRIVVALGRVAAIVGELILILEHFQQFHFECVSRVIVTDCNGHFELPPLFCFSRICSACGRRR